MSSVRSVIIVGIADDVFLREAVARLHFDYLQQTVACTFDAVFSAALDEDMLTVAQLEGLFVKCHFRCAAHYNPVFVTQLMALQAQSLTWLNG